MAGKNQVTLTFAGDSSKLTSEFDKVGSSAKTMSDDVGRSSKEVGDKTAAGFDKAGEGLDNTYDKFDALEAVGRGTTDTMSGFSEIMKGNVLQGSTDLAGGVAALADGFAGALIPGLKAGVTWLKNTTIAQKALNLAQRMSPIGLIITGLFVLGTLLVLLWKRSETFRNIVQGAMRGVAAAFGWIVKGFGAAWTVLSGAWSRFVGWVTGWPLTVGRFLVRLFSSIVTGFGAAWSTVGGAVIRFFGWIAGWQFSVYNRVIGMFMGIPSAFGRAWTAVSGGVGRFFGWVAGWPAAISNRVRGMFDGIKNAFKAALNWIIGKWNNLSFSIPGVDTHIPGVGTIGGFTLNTPDIPYFHRGGIMPGAPGSEGLAVLQAGERVTPAGRSEPVQIVVSSGGSRLDDLLVEVLRRSIRSQGGNVQLVLGTGRT